LCRITSYRQTAPFGESAIDPERSQSLALADLDLETLEQRLAAPGLTPGHRLAAALRDRAAGLLLDDPSQAMRIAAALRSAVGRASGEVDPETRAVAERAFAEACLYTGRLREARGAYEKATEHAAAAGSPSLLGQILVGRVGALTLMGIAEGTGRLIAQARRLLERTGDVSYLAKLHMNLGSAHYHAEHYREAYDDYARASRYFRAAGDLGGTWVGLRLNQGIACTHLFRLDEARQLFLETEERARELELDRLEAQAQFNLASLEALRGDYRQALSRLETAGSTFERQGIRDMQAASHLALAEIHLDLAMPGEALELARSASEAFGDAGMELDRNLANLAAARGFLNGGRPSEALPVLEGCLEFYTTKRIRPRRAEVQLGIARASLVLGRAGECLRRARGALRTFHELGIRQGEIRARCQLADAYLSRNEAERAENVLAPALARVGAQQAGIRFELWLLAGRVSRRRGRRRESLFRLRRAVRSLEDQRRLVPGPELRARSFDHRVTAYHHLIALVADSGRPRVAELFRLVEAARGRGFRERLGGKAVPLPRAIVEKRALLGSLSRRLESLDFGDSSPADDGERDRLRKSVLSLERTIARQVRLWEAGRSGGTHPVGTTTLDPLLRRIRRDEAVVEYFVADESMLVLVLRRDGARLRVLPAAAGDARAAVESLRFQIDLLAATASHPVGTEEFHLRSTEADLQTLYTMLVEPLEDVLPETGRLTLVPHRFLHLVPFECLHDGSSYVDRRWAVSRSPTADHLARRGRRGGAPRRALIAGMTEGGPSSIGPEIDTVASCFSDSDVEVLRNPSARAVVEAMPAADLVHLSTHGFFREDNPMFSRLSFEDGAIFVADILDLRLRANLVVLSACNSGQVFSGQGDDLSGVAHGFLAAGVKHLIAGLWRVHDEATADWMRSFYESLTGEARGDPRLALNAAGRAVRRRWPHPFYWGGFCLHGA
jgi:tetratricopeptide (TPR) repeat protein